MNAIVPNVFVETGYEHVTVGAILTDGGWICVDTPPYPADAHAWLAALREIADRPVRYVVLTDDHRDRILTSSVFGAPVVVHEAATAGLLDLGRNFMAQSANELADEEDLIVQLANLPFVPPQISYSDALQLDIGGQVIELLSRPGAAACGAWVRFPAERILFVGDAVCVNQHPRVRTGVGPWLAGLAELQGSQYAGWTLVGGRDGVFQPADIGPLAEYLADIQAQVGEFHRAARPRAELTELVPAFIGSFPYDQALRDRIECRIQAALEVVFDGLAASEAASSQR